VGCWYCCFVFISFNFFHDVAVTHIQRIFLHPRFFMALSTHGALGIQGDQIGRIFANWVIVYFGRFFNCTSSPHFWATYVVLPWLKLCVNFVKKWLGLGRFYPIFSQTHLVPVLVLQFTVLDLKLWTIHLWTSGANVMISIFCYIQQFSAKNWRLSSRTRVWQF
jgi:hypothetical protein